MKKLTLLRLFYAERFLFLAFWLIRVSQIHTTSFTIFLFYGIGKILDGKFSNAKNMILCVSKLRKLLVSLDIGQLNARVIFPVERSIFSETSK